MKKAITVSIIVIFAVAGGFAAWLQFGNQSEQKEAPVLITDFNECAEAGNPVMESFPRQCRANGRTFVEVIGGEPETEPEMTEGEARIIAEKNCIKGGEALGTGQYNENTRTWWFDANLNASRPGCNPACVVNAETGTTEINWRCTGLLPENGSEKTIAERLAECLPKSDMASHDECRRLMAEILNYDDCAAAGFSILKSNPPRCALPDGRVFVQETNGSWESATSAVNNCEVKRAFQTHDRIVTLELKSGNKLVVSEPEIDGIMKIIARSEPNCGPVPIATE